MSHTKPVNGCATHIRFCEADEQWLHQTASERLRRSADPPLSPTATSRGESYREAKENTTATRGALELVKQLAPKPVKVAGDIAKHQLLDRSLHAFGKYLQTAGMQVLGDAISGAARRLGSAMVVYEAVKLTSEAHAGSVEFAKAEGKRINQAFWHDAQRIVILAGAGDALDPEYRKSMVRDMHPVSLKLAEQLVTDLTHRDAARYEHMKQALHTAAEAGVTKARELQLTSPAELQRALSRDPELRAVYERDSAFAHGVQSAIFTAERARR
jgi:hypothetical protein